MRKITAMKATRTYLELTRPGQFEAAFGDFPDVLFERVERPTPELYRDCYRTVGEADLGGVLWYSTVARTARLGPQPEITEARADAPGGLAGWDDLRGVPGGAPPS